MQSDPRRDRRCGTGGSRRQFLRAGAAGAAGLAWAGRAGAGEADDRSVILLLLVGGPSQIDTFDPKPGAPSDVRGPFRSIATKVPGVRVCEHLPRLARRLDRVALVRAVHHDAAPIHETGLQLIQTGGLAGLGETRPHLGAWATRVAGPRGGAPGWAVLGGPLGSTGVAISQGQCAGPLGPEWAPYRPLGSEVERAVGGEPARVREAYGDSPFGRSCLLAMRLVEAGTRVVTVNMYPTVFGAPSWDVHGAGPFSTFDDYERAVLPAFDRAFAALLDDLERGGRLGRTLVVATGEFGRSSRINARGGRDHAPGAWTALAAGGGVRGGQVIGATDARGAEPRDRPVSAADLAATLARGAGLEGPGWLATAASAPVELFA